MGPLLRDGLGADARIGERLALSKRLSPHPLLKFQRKSWCHQIIPSEKYLDP